MTLVVRDEQDILAANLEYHLRQGVDLIFVIDHRSEDRTPEILDEYRRSGRVHAWREEDPAHDQARRVNRLLRMAEEHGADWIIHADADEFWVPVAGSLREVFAAVPDRFGYLSVLRNNFRPVIDDGRAFAERQIWRERNSKNLRGGLLEPKVAHRAGAAAGVSPGNHGLEVPTAQPAPEIGAVEVFHFPMRSFEQFERKVVNAGIGYTLLEDRAEGIGLDQLTLLEMHRRGELRAYYDGQTLVPAEMNGHYSNELVCDVRLRDRLRAGAAGSGEAGWVTDVLERSWRSAAQAVDRAGAQGEAIRRLTQERDELNAHAQQIGTDLDAARTDLDAVRKSRLMRYTAPARATYYRVRQHRGHSR